MTEDDTFDALKYPPTEDEIAFGRNVIVYCDQHLRPHHTGWCSVPNSHKTKMLATNMTDAYTECRLRGWTIYSER